MMKKSRWFPVLTPRCFFSEDFRSFQDYFFSQPHRRRTFARGDYLWRPERPFESVHYILSGVSQNYVEHENGRRKIISFHGPGTLFPGYHRQDYKIERSLITRALSPMEVLEFSKEEFRLMFAHNGNLSAAVVEWYAMYVNLLLYDTAHQEYNSSFLKLCNLLYLLADSPVGGRQGVLNLTQDDLADLLGISRANLTRGLTQLRRQGILRTRRGRVELLNLPALAQCCSEETHP